MSTEEITKINKIYQEKFAQSYKKVINECDNNFLTEFHAWCYVLDNFTNEQILDFLPDFMCKIFIDRNDVITFLYKPCVETFKEMIAKEQDKMILQIMSTASISQGEAMIMADEMFNEQVGYFHTFNLLLWQNVNVIRELYKE